ncbi:bifunctional precorrin-2 dehydrogenase/sirohydrochlorin ferrochelatase [Bacillota bacterium Lsc_1132]
MGSFYPMMLNLAGKKVVVVGGGKVAERKIKGLLETDARIVVVSPEATDDIARLSGEGLIEWMRKPFSGEEIQGALMIFATTNDRKLNQEIKDLVEPHQLVAIADDPDGSDFHVPAQVKRGRLSIAVSTNGASPTLARMIREQLEAEFDERYEAYVEFLYQARQKILAEVKDPFVKRKLLKKIASPEFWKSDDREIQFKELYEGLKR